MPVERYACEYNMKHNKRGMAIILNHEHFEVMSLKSRTGTNVDCENLRHALEHLHFDTTVLKDLRYTEIQSHIESGTCTNHHFKWKSNSPRGPDRSVMEFILYYRCICNILFFDSFQGWPYWTRLPFNCHSISWWARIYLRPWYTLQTGDDLELFYCQSLPQFGRQTKIVLHTSMSRRSLGWWYYTHRNG